MIGQGLRTSSALLLVLGLVTMVFGMLPGVNYFIPLPSFCGEARKRIPAWLGRLGFLAVGALLIYWALTLGRGGHPWWRPGFFRY